MNTYNRVELPDRRQGLILEVTKEGTRTLCHVLTDDYAMVIADPDQVRIIGRDQTSAMLEAHEVGGATYWLFTVEINRLIWYRMAIWHDYWTKHPAIDGKLPMGTKSHPEYWDFFKLDNIAELPATTNIRRSEGMRPTQNRMDVGGAKSRDH